VRKPDFFIVGAPRSGTTSMKTYLDKHPEIFMAPGREPHFFGTDFYRPLYIRDERTYLSLFATAINEKRVGEKSTRYLSSKRAAGEIKEFHPSASIITMLRNPVEMIYSMHNHHFNRGVEDLDDFKAALEAEEDRKRGLRLPMSLDSIEKYRVLYRETARYTQQVKRFLNAFGREKVHIIIFDDFIHSTPHTYREALKFLDVDPDFQPYFRKVNTNREVRSRALHAYLEDPPPFVQSLVKTVIPPQARYRLAKGIVHLNSKPAPRPPMKPALRRKLQEEFLPEVEQLSKLIGRDLTHWCQSD